MARKNIVKAGIGERVTIINGNLAEIKGVANESVDHIVSIYSPISFVRDKKKVFSEMYRILKKDGKVIIMGHGYFNAISSKINNYLASGAEIKLLEREYMVRWGQHVPKLNVFSMESMGDNLRKAGFSINTTYGVPVFVQPGPEDFDPKNKKKSRISKALDDKKLFKSIFDLEMKYNSYSSIVNKGMNIFTVAKK